MGQLLAPLSQNMTSAAASLLSLILCVHTGAHDEIPPPAIPSGMDLLYGNRIAVNSNGEPSVAVGLMTNQRTITVVSTGT